MYSKAFFYRSNGSASTNNQQTIPTIKKNYNTNYTQTRTQTIKTQTTTLLSKLSFQSDNGFFIYFFINQKALSQLLL